MKKFTSLVLALVMVITVASFSASANSGAKVMPEINSVYAANPDEVECTEELGGWCTYYFYMPEEWKNSYNDYYDGTEGSYCVGIYWWEYPFDAHTFANGWPGYAVLESEVENVYCAQVPWYVSIINWNNGVDSGGNPALEINIALHTGAISSAGYMPGDDIYGFYPDGVESFDGMIYVVNLDYPKPGVGDWFYYYGNAQYGQYPTLEEATAKNAVFSNGEFPILGGRPSNPPGTEHTHTCNKGTITKEPTCSEDGLKTFNCTECGEFIKSEVMPSTSHTEVFDNAVSPTCTTPGLTFGSHCYKCGEVIAAQKVIPVIAHNIIVTNKKSATYFANGYTGDSVCSDCNKTISKGKSIAKLKLKSPTVKLTGGKQKLTVKYTNVTGATGFQVKYKIGKKTVTKTYSTKKSATKAIKKLAKGTYKVQVRAFVKSGTNTAYSSWTKVAKVKVK